MQDKLLDSAFEALKTLDMTNWTLYLAGGIAVIFAIVVLPEFIYWASMRSVTKQLKELRKDLERIENKVDRLSESGPQPPAQAPERKTNSFPLTH